MKKIFLPARPVMIVFTMLAALLLFSPSIVSAYSVEIQNNTNGEIHVELHVYVFVYKYFGSADIGPGQSYTFSTGAKCPAYLEGIANTGNGWVTILREGCAGLLEGNSAGGICCFNIKFKVQNVDGIYKFIKQ